LQFLKTNEGGKEMDEDISNKTIVVLVVLTVIISVLGTVVVLGEVGSVKAGPMQPNLASARGSSSQGQVSVTINERPKVVNAAGLVTLDILPRT
jgi:hypothetical protein